MDFNPTVLQSKLEIDLNAGFHNTEARLSILSSFLKKLEPNEKSKVLSDAAVQTFLDANNRCKDYVLPDRLDILNLAKAWIYDMLYDGEFQSTDLTLNHFANYGRFGPGRSIGAKHCNFVHKAFNSDLTLTDTKLYSIYTMTIQDTWRAAEMQRKASNSLKLVSCSKIATVPKNNKTDRLVCTEPSLNMFFQLGAAAILERKLRKVNINLPCQPEIQKKLAQRGSIDGSLATIDLTSASDTISNTLCEYLLPPAVFKALKDISAKKCSFEGVEYDLHMMSTAGNGFTFPLQTLLFYSLVWATLRYNGVSVINYGVERNIGVNGDDIICPSGQYYEVIETLTSAGFVVNSEKSYGTGPFRESCGGDYFLGRDIRGVYLKRLKKPQDFISSFNRTYRWSVRQGIALPQTLQYLLEFCGERLLVPPSEMDDAGLHCCSSMVKIKNGLTRYRCYFPVEHKVVHGRLLENPDALLVGAIHGSLKDGYVTERTFAPSYKTVWRRTPNWDYIPHVGLTRRDYWNLSILLSQ